MRFRDKKDILFEPRAYWDVGTFQRVDNIPTDQDSSYQEITFNKDSFRNISRNPVQLTKLNLCSIGAATQDALDILGMAQFVISAPNRQSWSFSPLDASTWKQDPKAEPSMLYSESPKASGLWGLSRWNFDHPFMLPRNGVVQFDVSGVQYAVNPGDPETGPGEIGNAYYTFAFMERGGLFGGNARLRQRQTIFQNTPGGGVWPAGNGPVFPLYQGKVSGPTVNTWSPAGVFRSKTWRENEVTEGQMSSAIEGFQVLVDQITTDDEATVGPNTPTRAPMSSRLICRARTTAGPSGEWWWREGAPLCLVSPDAGPAITYKLPEAITLEPGDQLQIQCFVPRVYFGQAPDYSTLPFNVGVSLTGFAEVSG